MKQDAIVDGALKQISHVYTPLSESCQAALKPCMKLLVVQKKTMLVNAGQYADKAYFILEGAARAFYLKEGKDISDWFAFENEFISSINSFFLDVPSPYSIELLEESTLLELSRRDFSRLADSYHDFERLARMVVTKTMLQLQQRIVSIQFESARQGYQNLLVTRPDITQRVPLMHIASYLGITLETLSRIRHPKNDI